MCNLIILAEYCVYSMDVNSYTHPSSDSALEPGVDGGVTSEKLEIVKEIGVSFPLQFSRARRYSWAKHAQSTMDSMELKAVINSDSHNAV